MRAASPQVVQDVARARAASPQVVQDVARARAASPQVMRAVTRAPGRGGDSIGIAYLDEDQLTLEGVTFELGPPGDGGVSWDVNGDEIRAEDGNAVETLRFPE
ncbi:hypothetical protein BE17_31280 [Sorangium cellulosum]|uniref:Uncharacterized protein n=1 Tax=Sorangium cellulosum TaxID=56 RepID=A0A150R275_SORCE|nr:hypothetical protein BE17_31280 [Sorangium cellulosum]